MALLTSAEAVHAASSCNTLNGNDAVAAGAISVPANAAPGSIVSTVNTDFILQCRNVDSGTISYTSRVDLQATGTLSPGYNDVYQTNITNLGVRYTVSAPDCTNADNVILTGTDKTAFTCAWTTGSAYQQRMATVKVEFVVTGTAPGSGNLTTVPNMRLWYTESDVAGTWEQNKPLSGAASGSLSSSSCSIPQKNLTVNLDDINVSDLASDGATAAPKIFNLDLTCPATDIKLALTLTDSTDPSNRTSILKPAAGSTSGGVAFQFLDGQNRPILMGPDSAIAGNTNQIVIGTTAGSPYINIPLSVRYIRTGTITPGTLKSIATYTLSYQ
ncbi:fimbrial protein [Buttiauxella selenatireducens]|uniref:Fimbrial protein n=1 Tax=Buttiauxella selenatireducens TaxID=3073902 RepID=A0ABY9SEW5_9ENTR|nr:fimbrial protein [Buttiauxella sp. R73]WMY75939.1 fimbrial protein [Buttiauxella sp. R73]